MKKILRFSQIYSDLVRFSQIYSDPGPPTEAEQAALNQLMGATLIKLRDILAPLQPRLIQNQVSLDDLCIDCLILDSQLSKEEMLA